MPNSVCALLCFVVLLAASIGYLVTGRPTWDLVAVAAAEAGFVFATILNATGMLFSRAEWNVWWTPSPRLVTSALLWFLYAVYLILRVSLPGSRRRTARICAVFGILAFLDVPLVFVSARFIPDIHRPNFSLEFRLADAGPDAGHGRNRASGRRPDLASHQPSSQQPPPGGGPSPYSGVRTCCI